MNQAWKRIAHGQHTAIVGVGSVAKSAEFSGPMFVVDCRLWTAPFGSITDLLRQMGAALPQQWRRVTDGSSTGFVDAVNRALAERSMAALVFEHAEFMDEQSVQVLSAALRASTWLSAPMLLCFGGLSGRPGETQLLDALKLRAGEQAVLELSQRPETPLQFELKSLSETQLLVARAAATLGEVFSTRQLAALLERSETEVLQILQAAADRGLPLADRGDGQLVIPLSVAARLKSSLLPSLRAAYERQIREGQARPEAPVRAQTETPARTETPAQIETPAQTSQQPTSASPASETPRPAAPEPMAAVPDFSDPNQRRQQRAKELLLHVRHARELGAFDNAVAAARRAQALLAEEGEVELQAQLMLELGKTLFMGAGTAPELTLEAALKSLEDGQELVPHLSPEEQAECCSLLAHVYYEIGDSDALEAALGALNDASRQLLETGNALDAARLLNDEAAIWIRIGDVVRGNHLLEKSREVFAARASDDLAARRELADSEHLVARLILHARPRAGKEHEAVALGIQRAQQAASIYAELQDEREQARVRETLGRLHLSQGDLAAAVAELDQALEMQAKKHDAVGLAKTTAAVADVLRQDGQYRAALSYLERSLRFNLATGSNAGIEYNRHWCERFIWSLPAQTKAELAKPLSALQSLLNLNSEPPKEA